MTLPIQPTALTLQCFVAATEILDDPGLAKDETALSLMLSYVREIGLKAIDAEEKDRHSSTRILKRIIRVLQKAAVTPSDAARRSVNVPLELHDWVKHRADKDPANPQSDKITKIIFFLFFPKIFPNYFSKLPKLFFKIT